MQKSRSAAPIPSCTSIQTNKKNTQKHALMAPNNLKPIDKIQHRHNKSPLSQGYRKPQWPKLMPKKTRCPLSLNCGSASYESAPWNQHVRILGLWYFGYMFAEWRITGKGTSCFATHTICTRSNTSLNFNNPNWARDFAPLIWFLWLFIGLLSLSGLLWLDIVCGFWWPPQWLSLRRAACVATTLWVASSLPSFAPHYMHATSASYGNVL